MADDAVPYHRLAHGRGWWRPPVELVLAIVFGFVLTILIIAVATGIAGVEDLNELSPESSFALTLAVLAGFAPSAMLAAKAMRRKPGALSSTALRLRWRWLARCVLYALLATVLMIVLLTVLDSVFGVGDDDSDSQWVGWDRFLPMAAILIALVPLQAAGEEYICRGTLVQCIGAFTRSPWPAIIVSAIAFAALHWTGIEATAMLLVMGGITAWLTIRTGGLEAAIAEHAVSNVLVLVASAAFDIDQLGVGDPNADVTWIGSLSQVAMLVVYALLVVRRFDRYGARTTPTRTA